MASGLPLPLASSIDPIPGLRLEVVSFYYARWGSDADGAVGDIVHDYGVSSDYDVIADMDAGEYLRVHPEEAVISDRGLLDADGAIPDPARGFIFVGDVGDHRPRGEGTSFPDGQFTCRGYVDVLLKTCAFADRERGFEIHPPHLSMTSIRAPSLKVT